LAETEGIAAAAAAVVVVAAADTEDAQISQ